MMIVSTTFILQEPLVACLFPFHFCKHHCTLSPTTAIAPLFVLWFGYGIWSKVLVTVLITFFPITITVYVSQAPSLDDLYVDLAAG